MLGAIYGVIQITQDVTDQYVNVQRYVVIILLVASGLMAFLFVTLTLIVRRGERILIERAEEQKLLEDKLQQSEKLASIGQMVATIAHEIRNPLGIIRSSAEVLSQQGKPGRLENQKVLQHNFGGSYKAQFNPNGLPGLRKAEISGVQPRGRKRYCGPCQEYSRTRNRVSKGFVVGNR